MQARSVWGIAGILAAAFFSQPAHAAESPVVATVDGSKIYLSEVQAAQQFLPEQFRDAPFDQMYELVLNALVDRKIAAREGVRQGLDREVEVRAQMERIREQILERAVISRHIDQQITEGLIQSRYADLIANAGTRKEAKVRHILLETREEAERIIGLLDDGADFAEMATAHSTGPSAKTGGDIGAIVPGDTVAAFETAVFAQAPGAHSAAPVKTEFGWHVILVEAFSDRAPPTLAEVRDDIVAGLSREIGLAYIKKLRSAAKVEHFTPDSLPSKP